MLKSLKHTSILPLFALGMSYQKPVTMPGFFQSAPSSEELSRDEMDEQQNVNAVEGLKKIPGIVIQGSEVTTSPGALFLRGSDADHTLFVWNEIRADNFTSPNGATDPFSFSTEFSNRIRVLKGPQSLLYGTQALGGVILIDDEPDGPSQLEIGTGSLGTTKGVGEARIRREAYQLAVGGSAFSTEGVSAYDAAPYERDGRERSSASVILSVDLPSEDQLQFLLQHAHEQASYDLPPKDDVNAHSETRLTQWKARYLRHWNDTAESVFLLTGQDVDRDNRNPVDTLNPDFYQDRSLGTREVFLNRNSFQAAGLLWHAGIEVAEERGRFSYLSNASAFTEFQPRAHDESVYLVNDLRFPNADASWGLRGNCQDSKDCRAVYQLSYQHHWVSAQRTLYGLLSTGLKRPTMYQLYSSYGDPNLKAETSQAMEVGLVQRWDAEQTLKVALFENRFADLIDFDFNANKSKNTREAKTRGVELSHQFETVFWDTQVSFAQIYAKNESTSQYLLRRPVYQGALSVGWNVVESFRIATELNYLGEREDVDATNARVRVASTTLWNLILNYKMPWAGVFLRVNNVGNSFYQDIYGYQTPGRFFWTGFKTNF